MKELSPNLKQSVHRFLLVKICFVIRNFSVRWFALVWTTLPKVTYRRLPKNILFSYEFCWNGMIDCKVKIIKNNNFQLYMFFFVL